MSRIRVITVDDEAHVHDGLDALIAWESLGFTHETTASNGAEALGTIARSRPEVIITDIRMPEVDGLTLIRRVRRISGYRPWIVVLSGYDDFDYARAALRLDVDDYLLKPIDEVELEGVLQRIRDRSRSEDDPGGAQRAALWALTKRLATESVPREIAEEVLLLMPRRPAGPVSACVAVPVSHQPISELTRRTLSDVAARLSVTTTAWTMDTSSCAIGFVVETDAGEHELRLRARGIHKAFRDAVGIPMLIVVGRPVDHLSTVNLSTRSIVRYLSDRHSVIEGAVVALDPRPAAEWVIEPRHWAALTDALDRLDERAFAGVLREAFVSMERSGVSALTLSDLSHGILAEASRALATLRIEPPSELRSVRDLADSAAFLTLDRIRDGIRDAVGATIRVLGKERKLNAHPAVSLAANRLRRRPNAGLSLQEIAGEFRMSPAHLGRVFHEVTGVSFREYQRRCRVRESCRILRETDLSIPEVAEEVGFRDSDYFASVFKSLVGTTPHSFRQSQEPYPELLDP